MTIKVRLDSIYKFGAAYFDEQQGQQTWGILDPPDPVKREDDQFYTLREEDKLDALAHRMLGNVNYIWVIMHYNNIKDALDLDKYVGTQLRIPSRTTVERIYSNAFGEPTFNS